MINQIRLELLAKGSTLHAREGYARDASLNLACGTPITPVDNFNSSK
jgi:hypothetical protein